MPELNGKKYAYNKEGMRRYKLDKAKKKKDGKAKKLSSAQKKIASASGDPEKIEGSDFKALKQGAKKKLKEARRHLRKKDVA